MSDSFTYDSFGDVSGYSASYNSSLLYSVRYTRDAGSRLVTKTETTGGTTTTYGYTYDTAGRLTAVTQNGALATSYSYDKQFESPGLDALDQHDQRNIRC